MVKTSDALCARLQLGGEIPQEDAAPIPYRVVNLPIGVLLIVVAGLISGPLGIGAGALNVTAMDHYLQLTLKVSSATSNFMIGVTAGQAR